MLYKAGVYNKEDLEVCFSNSQELKDIREKRKKKEPTRKK